MPCVPPGVFERVDREYRCRNCQETATPKLFVSDAFGL